MEKVLSHKGTFDRREDMPPYDEDKMLVRWEERQVNKIDKATNKLTPTGQTKYFLIMVSRDDLPTIEKEYLADHSDLLKLEQFFLRPTRVLTRDECNTRAGRMALLSWCGLYPKTIYTHDGVRVVNDYNDEMNMIADDTVREMTGEHVTFSGLSDNALPYIFWEPTARQNAELYRVVDEKTLAEKYDGLFSPICMCAENYYSFSTPPIYRDNLPDMAFAVDLNTEILNRDQFAAIVEAKADPRAVPVLMQKYDYCQKMVDRLFATYELFRTEKYESIAALPLNDQRAAVRNYFATFTYYGNRGEKVVAKIGGHELLTYKKPKYVVSNMAKEMGIPSEVLTYARKTIAVEPLFDKPAAEITEQDTGRRRSGIISKEPDRQRTNWCGARMRYFGDFAGCQLTIWDAMSECYIDAKDENGKEMVLTHDLLNTATYNAIINKKLDDEIMFALTTQSNFNVEAAAESVAAIKSKDDIPKTFFTFTIDAKDIIQRVYGKISGLEYIKRSNEEFLTIARAEASEMLDNRGEGYTDAEFEQVTKERLNTINQMSCVNFETRIKLRGNEPFVFYPAVQVKDDKTGKTSIICANANNYKKLYRKYGGSPITYYGPRFIFGGWIIQGNKIECVIHVSPVYFSNMLNPHGKIDSYKELTPEYMAASRSFGQTNGGFIGYAVLSILERIHDRQFAQANAVEFSAKRQAKKEGKDKPTDEELEALRTKQFDYKLDKDKLFAAVCANMLLKTDDITPSKRTRIQQYIEQALHTIQANGVLINDYHSAPDGSAWILHFKLPS